MTSELDRDLARELRERSLLRAALHHRASNNNHGVEEEVDVGQLWRITFG
jgi:hypothetical protein